MRNVVRFAAVVLVVAFVSAGRVWAAFDAYLNFGDIKGESTDKDHKDWIMLQSFSWGLPHHGPVASSSRTAMRSALQSLTITKRIDSASPKLMAARQSARFFNVVTLESGYMKYELRNVIILSYSRGGAGGVGPTETITLTYASMTQERLPQSPRVGSMAPNSRLLVHHP